MNKAFPILLIVLLLLPIQILSQENEYRIITDKLDTVYGKQYFNGKKDVIVTDTTGKNLSFPSHKLLSIRKEIEGWKYFEWGPDEFTDYLKISIDSMSKEELFNLANEWIGEFFISTEHGFLIQPDSVFTEREGRKLYRYPYSRKKLTFIKDGLPKIIPELKHKFTVDKENYKITLVGCNHLIIDTCSTFYTLNLTFVDGGYEIEPVDLFYCKTIFEDKSYLRRDFNIWDMILYPDIYEEYCSPSLPFNVAPYKDDTGTIRLKYRCLATRIEILFNDLNRSLFNYLKGDKGPPNIYVYYPQTTCWDRYRKW